MKHIILFFFVSLQCNLLAQSPIFTTVIADTAYLLHTVNANEKIYDITKKYGITLLDLYDFNPSKVEKYISADEIVKIPVAKIILKSKDVDSLKHNYLPIYHTVQAKESLASLKRLYNVPMSTLRNWNNLNNDTLKINSTLIVAWLIKTKNNILSAPSATYIPLVVNAPELPVTSAPPALKENIVSNKNAIMDKSLREFYLTQLASGNEITDAGIGKWFDIASASTDLCMHATAPVGTIVKFKNVMNDRVVYLRVIGNLPSSGENSGVIIRISAATAKQVTILDKKFRCEVSYVL